MNTILTTSFLNRSFYVFLLLHLIIWGFLPALFRNNLPLDAMECVTWGQQLQWGYDKNPFLIAWLAKMAMVIGNHTEWYLYILSQLSILLCFVATWSLAKNLLPPLYAFISILLLETIQYYNLHAIDLSDNSIEVGIWACIVLFFYRALKTNRWGDWLLCGVFSSLGLMTKYYTGILLFSLFLFLILTPTTRPILKKPEPYLGLLFCFIIIFPHIMWLFSNDFITIDYMLERGNNKKTDGFHHIFYALQFTIQQLEIFILPVCLILICFMYKKTVSRNISISLSPSTFDKQFLFFAGIFPFILTILLSMIFGIKLRAAWGQPLFSLWGILLLLWLKPHITEKRFFIFILTLASLVMITIGIYCFHISHTTKPSSALFPGTVIAKELTDTWHKKFKTPLHYVAGGRWLAGNIAFYSKDHPMVFMEWNKKINPWVQEKKMKEQGALFVWDLSAINRRREISPKVIKKQFPCLTEFEIKYYSWQKHPDIPPVKILLAWLPPDLPMSSYSLTAGSSSG